LIFIGSLPEQISGARHVVEPPLWKIGVLQILLVSIEIFLIVMSGTDAQASETAL
jgi:hypothetical protein